MLRFHLFACHGLAIIIFRMMSRLALGDCWQLSVQISLMRFQARVLLGVRGQEIAVRLVALIVAGVWIRVAARDAGRR